MNQEQSNPKDEEHYEEPELVILPCSGLWIFP